MFEILLIFRFKIEYYVSEPKLPRNPGDGFIRLTRQITPNLTFTNILHNHNCLQDFRRSKHNASKVSLTNLIQF